MSKQAEVIKNRWTELPLDDLHLLNRIDDMSYAQLSETDQELIKEIQEKVTSRRPREQLTKPCCYRYRHYPLICGFFVSKFFQKPQNSGSLQFCRPLIKNMIKKCSLELNLKLSQSGMQNNPTQGSTTL